MIGIAALPTVAISDSTVADNFLSASVQKQGEEISTTRNGLLGLHVSDFLLEPTRSRTRSRYGSVLLCWSWCVANDLDCAIDCVLGSSEHACSCMLPVAYHLCYLACYLYPMWACMLERIALWEGTDCPRFSHTWVASPHRAVNELNCY